MTNWQPTAPAAAIAAALLLSLPTTVCAHGGDDRYRRDRDKEQAEIVILSNRADLISGGSALVEVVLPTRRGKPTVKASQVRVELNGENVTGAFAVRADGRFYGLVGGLQGVEQL